MENVDYNKDECLICYEKVKNKCPNNIFEIRKIL